jgi:GntR family transcriptional regulator
MENTIKVIKQSVTDQISLIIKKSILNNEYKPNEQLPALSSLANKFEVSNATIREAIRKLEAVGLVEIMHGKGVFVRNPEFQLDWLTRFTSFSEAIRRHGKIPGSKLLEGELISANKQIAAALSVIEGSQIYHLRRLRFSDNEPIAIEKSYLPEKLVPDLLKKYRDPMSLYELIEEEYGIQLISDMQTIEAVALTAEESILLESKPLTPALLLKSVVTNQQDVPIEFGITLFRGDKYRYVVKLKR